MRKMLGMLAVLVLVTLLPLTAMAGGDHYGDKCKYKPWKCSTTTTSSTTTSTIPTTTTTTVGTTTTTGGTTSTTTGSTTTTTEATTTSTEATTTTVSTPSFEPGWFCEDDMVWLAVDYEVDTFARIDVWLENPIGVPESTFLSPGEFKWGVLTTDTYFTFVGLLYDESTVTVTLDVPGAHCTPDESSTSTVPEVEETTVTTSSDPSDPTLPVTGEETDLVLHLGLLLAVSGLSILGVGWVAWHGRSES